jgi:hypothetical protein
MPAHRHEAAEHTPQCNDKSDQNSHGAPFKDSSPNG